MLGRRKLQARSTWSSKHGTRDVILIEDCMTAATPLIDAILGNWHLVELEADELELPRHRVDLLIRRVASGLTGAVLSRIDGTEALALVVEFDGSTLRLQMEDPKKPKPVDAPWLVMANANDRFEGHWHNAAGEPTGPTLKLVRAKE